MTFQEMTNTVSNGVSDALKVIWNILPELVGAVLIVVIGLVIAAVLKRVVQEVFKVAKLDELIDKSGVGVLLDKAQVKTSVGDAVGALVYWITVVIFVLPAAKVVNVVGVNDLLDTVLAYAPSVARAVLILFLGGLVAGLVSAFVRALASLAGSKGSAMLGNVSRYIVVTFAVLLAIGQLGLPLGFLNTLLTGVVAAAAIGVGLAVGLGGKDTASRIVENVYSKLSK